MAPKDEKITAENVDITPPEEGRGLFDRIIDRAAEFVSDHPALVRGASGLAATVSGAILTPVGGVIVGGLLGAATEAGISAAETRHKATLERRNSTASLKENDGKGRGISLDGHDIEKPLNAQRPNVATQTNYHEHHAQDEEKRHPHNHENKSHVEAIKSSHTAETARGA